MRRIRACWTGRPSQRLYTRTLARIV